MAPFYSRPASLQAAGCGLLAVHARQRGSETRRRAGAADLSAVRAIKHALSIPVVTNGNVRNAKPPHPATPRTQAAAPSSLAATPRNPAATTGVQAATTDVQAGTTDVQAATLCTQVRKATDVAAALRRTRADGAMVAEPLLRYPALLSAAAEERCVAPLTADQTD